MVSLALCCTVRMPECLNTELVSAQDAHDKVSGTNPIGCLPTPSKYPPIDCQNQQMTGIISAFTFPWLLKQRAGQDWGCPECDGANSLTQDSPGSRHGYLAHL